jgi:hypothetical protein
MVTLARAFAFGAGAFTACIVIGEAINLGLMLNARRLERA